MEKQLRFLSKTEIFKTTVQENVSIIVNDLILEAMTNNFILSNLIKSQLLTDDEAKTLRSPQVLLEDNSGLKTIYNNVLERSNTFPKILLAVLSKNTSDLAEAKRNYAMEYRNYHGKPKQRKERAARTKAREQMIKKGKVRKGDGKDIDHKKPLRNGGSHGINNLRIRDRSENRSDNGHKKGEKQDKDWK